MPKNLPKAVRRQILEQKNVSSIKGSCHAVYHSFLSIDRKDKQLNRKWVKMGEQKVKEEN